MNLFSAFLTSEVLCVQSISVASYTVSDSGSLECQIEAFLYVSTVYFHTHHHLPTGIDLITGIRYRWYITLEVWICFIQFSLKAHKPLCQCFDSGAQPPDLIDSKERTLVLVMQCPTSLCCCHTVFRHILSVTYQPHHNNAVFNFHDVMGLFCIHSSNTVWVLHSSIFHHYLSFLCCPLVFFCEYFFCYFCIPERRLYFNSVRMCVQVCNQNESSIYIIWGH